jgi:hypothetical protein
MPDDHAPPRSFAIVKQLTPVRLVMVDSTALEGSLFIARRSASRTCSTTRSPSCRSARATARF